MTGENVVDDGSIRVNVSAKSKALVKEVVEKSIVHYFDELDKE